jgi:hypothetical protein
VLVYGPFEFAEASAVAGESPFRCEIRPLTPAPA